MIKLKISYETKDELAALVRILNPYVLEGKKPERKGDFPRAYIYLDPAKIEQMLAKPGNP